jgi:rhodanese-related sulfurtransferase
MCISTVDSVEYKTNQRQRMKLISGGELKEKLDKGANIKLVFVLGDWQYRAKHIPGSLYFHKLEEALKVLNQNDEIVVYCSNPACPASIFAYHFLADHAYNNVRRYAGGLLDWEDAGYPLEGQRVN